MVDAHQFAANMGDHKPNPTNDTGNRYAPGGCDSSKKNDDPAGFHGVNTQCVAILVTERQQVDFPNIPPITGTAAICIWSYVLFAKLPICQKVMAGSVSELSAVYFISAINAAKIDETTIPPNTTDNVSVLFLRPAKKNTSRTLNNPNVKDSTGVKIPAPPNNKIPNAAPKPAPEHTPKRSGLTNGF